MVLKGIAIKTLERGFYSGREVVELHRQTLAKGKKVYFSTGIRVRENMAPAIEHLLLYNIDEDFFFICHAEKVLVKKEKWIPEDAGEMIPEVLRDMADRTWFLVDSMEEVTDYSLFKNLITKNKEEPLLSTLQNAGRANAIYFRSRNLVGK